VLTSNNSAVYSRSITGFSRDPCQTPAAEGYGQTLARHRQQRAMDRPLPDTCSRGLWTDPCQTPAAEGYGQTLARHREAKLSH